MSPSVTVLSVLDADAGAETARNPALTTWTDVCEEFLATECKAL